MQEFFTPVSDKVLCKHDDISKSCLGNTIDIYTSHSGFPDLSKINLALFGVKESRNSLQPENNPPSFNSIRKALYKLQVGNWHQSIADLGDIAPGNTIDDTYFAVQKITHELLSQNIIPIIIGGSQDLLYPVYKGFEELYNLLQVVNFDSKFDLGNPEAPISNESYVGAMVASTPYNLENYSVIGYQSYFNPTDEIQLFNQLFFEAYRLGEVIQDLTSIEPALRDADLTCIDFTSVKSSEIGGINTHSPNGFTSREICAAARYAGISNKLKAFGVFETHSTLHNEVAAMLVAQIIWYFIEGVNFRIQEGSFNSDKDFTTYKVPIDDKILTFKKSSKSLRWWIQIENINTTNNNTDTIALLPCSHNDYKTACQQELPQRWLNNKKKYNL